MQGLDTSQGWGIGSSESHMNTLCDWLIITMKHKINLKNTFWFVYRRPITEHVHFSFVFAVGMGSNISKLRTTGDQKKQFTVVGYFLYESLMSMRLTDITRLNNNYMFRFFALEVTFGRWF
jgi:hypothetical protein